MGATLSSRLERTSALSAEAVTPLSTSVINYDLLNDFIRVLEKLCTEHPAESRIEFKRPIEWTSSFLRPGVFHAVNIAAAGGTSAGQQQQQPVWNVVHSNK